MRLEKKICWKKCKNWEFDGNVSSTKNVVDAGEEKILTPIIK